VKHTGTEWQHAIPPALSARQQLSAAIAAIPWIVSTPGLRPGMFDVWNRPARRVPERPRAGALRETIWAAVALKERGRLAHIDPNPVGGTPTLLDLLPNPFSHTQPHTPFSTMN
jgi:hypothetical protein